MRGPSTCGRGRAFRSINPRSAPVLDHVEGANRRVAYVHAQQAGGIAGVVDELAITAQERDLLERHDVGAEPLDEAPIASRRSASMRRYHRSGNGPGPMAARMFQLATRSAATVT